MSKKRFLLGTFILTCTGFLSRILGFFYRIFLSHTIGAQGLGIVQLTVPIQTLALAVSASGIQTAISRLTASRVALKEEKSARQCFFLGTGTALLLSFLCCILLYVNADFFALEILKEGRTLPLLKILAFTFPLSTLHTCVNSYYFARKQSTPAFSRSAFGAACAYGQHLYSVSGFSYGRKRSHTCHCSRRRSCKRNRSLSCPSSGSFPSLSAMCKTSFSN